MVEALLSWIFIGLGTVVTATFLVTLVIYFKVFEKFGRASIQTNAFDAERERKRLRFTS